MHQNNKAESSITGESLLGREKSMYQSLQQEHGRFKELTESQYTEVERSRGRLAREGADGKAGRGQTIT